MLWLLKIENNLEYLDPLYELFTSLNERERSILFRVLVQTCLSLGGNIMLRDDYQEEGGIHLTLVSFDVSGPGVASLLSQLGVDDGPRDHDPELDEPRAALWVRIPETVPMPLTGSGWVESSSSGCVDVFLSTI
jgi:hypothetical protein